MSETIFPAAAEVEEGSVEETGRFVDAENDEP